MHAALTMLIDAYGLEESDVRLAIQQIRSAAEARNSGDTTKADDFARQLNATLTRVAGTSYEVKPALLTLVVAEAARRA